MSTDVNDTLVCGCFYFKDDLEEDQVKFSKFKKAARASSFLLTHSDFCLGFQRVIWAVQLRNKGWMHRLWGYHPSTRGLFTPVCFVLLHSTVPGTGLLLARNSCTFQEMSFSAVVKHTTWLCRGRDCALLLGGAGRAAAHCTQPLAQLRQVPTHPLGVAVKGGTAGKWFHILQVNTNSWLQIFHFESWVKCMWLGCVQIVLLWCYYFSFYIELLKNGDLLPQPTSFEVTWRISWLLAAALPMDDISFPLSIHFNSSHKVSIARRNKCCLQSQA